MKKRTINREITIGPTAIKFVTLAIFAILAMVYLTQATAGANRSVKVRDVNSKKAQLELEQERLEVETVRLQSLQQIDQNIEKPTMEPISKVEHIQEGTGSLALR